MGSAHKKLRITLQHEELLPELPEYKVIENWITKVLRQEACTLGCVYYVFLSDEALLNINREYLQHDTYTDIITFPYEKEPLEGEIYISADRVRANAIEYNVPVREEALRVMIHGILHLCGWDDKDDVRQLLMRKRENACLSLLHADPSFSSFSPS